MGTKLFYVLLFITSCVFAQFPTNGLIAQYGFENGNLLVDGANGQNFTQTGTALVEINDRFGNPPSSAITLNGDYLKRSDLSFGDYVSYSFWIKTSSSSTTRKVIIDDSNRNQTNASTWVGTRISELNGIVRASIRYRWRDSAGGLTYDGISATSTTDISDGKWHHIVVLIESRTFAGSSNFGTRSSIEVFIDKQADGAANRQRNRASFSQRINVNGDVTIANDRTNTLSNAERYDGSIDDILIYGRKLNTTEIQSIADANSYCFSPVNSIISVPSTTETTATVDVASNGNVYDIAYHKTSEPFSNAIIVSNVMSGTSTSQVNLPGLDVFTEYQLYIRQQCTNTTGWSTPISFTTSRLIGKIYVNKNATGLNNGINWTNAYTELSDALNIAEDNEEIWIAGGTYNPHPTDRSIYFTISKENLKLYGGFAGTEVQISDRMFGTNETILSGDLQANDVNTTEYLSNYNNTTRNADNSYHIINIQNTGQNLLLDGLTISDAHNNLSTTERGGAIVKHKNVAILSLNNCIVKNNVSRNDNAGLIAEFELYLVVSGANAGTINGGNGELNIKNCEFTGNMSRWGSGLYSFVRANSDIQITIANSLFNKNIAGDLNNTSARGLSGSAMWLRNISGNNTSSLDIDVVNSTFVNNKDTGTQQSLNNFTRATVALSQSTTNTTPSNAVVSNCIFWNNKSAGNAVVRSITDVHKFPMNTLQVNNSIDEANFNDDSISTKVNTSNSNPLFVDMINNNFSLQFGSPAINTGDNTKVLRGNDLANNPRILNATVDIGAFEFLSNSWTGTIDNDWFTAANWSKNVIPSNSDAIYIPQGLTNYPTASGAVTVGTVDIASGGSLIAQGNFTGNVTYNRNLPTSSWYMIASPVLGQDVDDFVTSSSLSQGTGNNLGLATYITLDGTWNYYQDGTSSSATLDTGKGYSVNSNKVSGDLSFTGNLNTNDVILNLTTTGNGFNLVGNPYTSYINSTAMLSGSTSALSSQTLWVWDQSANAGTGAYVTKVAADNFQIAPAQGFFVQSSGSAGNLVINKTVQNHQTTSTFSRGYIAERPELHLNLKDGTNDLETKIYFIDGASIGFDNGYDGVLFGGVTNDTAIYTKLITNDRDGKYAVQSLPNNEYETMRIPLGINAASGSEITISAETLHLPEGINVYLEDVQNNSFTLLNSETNFKENLTENMNGVGRFYIHTRSGILDVPSTKKAAINMYMSSTRNLRIIGVTDVSKLEIYTIQGKLMYKTELANKGVNDVSLTESLSTGVYIIKLNTEQGNLTKKIVLK